MCDAHTTSAWSYARERSLAVDAFSPTVGPTDIHAFMSTLAAAVFTCTGVPIASASPILEQELSLDG